MFEIEKEQEEGRGAEASLFFPHHILNWSKEEVLSVLSQETRAIRKIKDLQKRVALGVLDWGLRETRIRRAECMRYNHSLLK